MVDAGSVPGAAAQAANSDISPEVRKVLGGAYVMMRSPEGREHPEDSARHGARAAGAIVKLDGPDTAGRAELAEFAAGVLTDIDADAIQEAIWAATASA